MHLETLCDCDYYFSVTHLPIRQFLALGHWKIKNRDANVNSFQNMRPKKVILMETSFFNFLKRRVMRFSSVIHFSSEEKRLD